MPSFDGLRGRSRVHLQTLGDLVDQSALVPQVHRRLDQLLVQSSREAMFQFPTASTPILEFDTALFRSVTQDLGQPAAITANDGGDFFLRDILQIKFPSLVTLRGRARRGERLIAKVTHGHWKTTTFLAARG